MTYSLDATATNDLLHDLRYETHPGAHTFSPSSCGVGHWSRRYACAECIDAELRFRGIDVVENGRGVHYVRVDGRIRRKVKGEA